MTNSSCMRVLLVEDSGVLAGRITELIERLPHVELIGTVDTEADAVDRIASAAPDVLILDLHLRDGSGFGVLRSLGRASARRPKVIVLTGFDLPQYRHEAETLGVDAFLNKSRDYHRLPVLLSSYAAQRGTQPAH
ncbi:MAG TPA: response regulator [Steroidobacteraceae bacterium]|nr:response regulator [Steroidobacteraceae bacterium]